MDSRAGSPGPSAKGPAHCVFCRMPTEQRFLRLPMCPICRDQSYDFLWASGVQTLVAFLGGLSGFWFLAEEAMLLVVLVFVKHRVTPPWERRHGP